MINLELVTEWLTVHENFLERWESRKYFGFKQIAQNEIYSLTLAKILSVSVPSGVGANAFISMTGMEKLDN